MLEFIKSLPVELVGSYVFGYLTVKDLVWLERASCSRASMQLFLQCVPHCPAVIPPSNYYFTPHYMKIMCKWLWFAVKRLRIQSINIHLPGSNNMLYMNILFQNIELVINSDCTVEDIQILKDHGLKVTSLRIVDNQHREVIEQLSKYVPNVIKLYIDYTCESINWLTEELVSNWNLQYIDIQSGNTEIIVNIIKYCPELYYICLCSEDDIQDAGVIAICQHCLKLKKLIILSDVLTHKSLLALSEQGTTFEELETLPYIDIPTADIAKRCSHALSCIRHLNTRDFHIQNKTLYIPYLTGLQDLHLDSSEDLTLIPLFNKYCHTLKRLGIGNNTTAIKFIDILPLVKANIYLQDISVGKKTIFTDTMLLQLVQTTSTYNLHTLCLCFQPHLTDNSILALSKHCTQLTQVYLSHSHLITKSGIIQLLQHLPYLQCLHVSDLSLTNTEAAEICLLYKQNQKLRIECFKEST